MSKGRQSRKPQKDDTRGQIGRLPGYSNSCKNTRVSRFRILNRNKNKNKLIIFECSRVFELTADINSGTIFSLVSANALFFGLAMYIMEHVKFSFIKTRYSFINYVSYFSNNLILLFQSSLEIASFCFRVICIICSLMWPYLFCYYASHTTDRILTIDNVAYDLNWYDCPLEVQKNLMFLIARSHQPIRFRGFKLIPCTLEGFGRVKEILSHL